jgi:cytochrome b subunit of formate dehydrogenase
MLELLFLASSIHTGAAFAGIALTIAGIVFYYLAITRSSRAYQARKGSVLDALEKE